MVRPLYRMSCIHILTERLGDHIFGILPLLASRLNGAGGIVEGEDSRAEEVIDQEVRRLISQRESYSIPRSL